MTLITEHHHNNNNYYYVTHDDYGAIKLVINLLEREILTNIQVSYRMNFFDLSYEVASTSSCTL